MLSGDQRREILAAARGLLGVPYDHSHADTSWKNLSAKPRSLDCSTFVCRVAAEALRLDLPASAASLIDQLAVVASPQPGDLVGYGRAGKRDERLAGYDALWHVMLYAGNGEVIGACDLAGAVVVRPIAYDESLGRRRWRFVLDEGDAPSPYRVLELAQPPTMRRMT
jgi:cell wall-associated NlpC family hydrolase